MLARLIPPTCIACRGTAETAHADPLCGPCRRSLPWLGPRVCARCALPLPCGSRCPARAHAFSGAWSPVAYAGPVPALVTGLKDHGALGLARLMAAQIAATAPPGLWGAPPGAPAAPPPGSAAADARGAAPPPVALVPVPADPLRRRRRGVDHAARLAGELAPRCGLPVAAVLRRRRASVRQARRSRSQRLRADPEAVGVRTGPWRAVAVPAVAILVDDVHTTGATLHACALALRAAGAAEVRAVTYARTLT
jgi:predicted amidophosphoribosyltransferase